MKRVSMLIATLVMATAGSAVAKPLYITVPRAYGPNEPVVVDLAFATADPVELRVLRSKDLGKLITSQVNLRRTYDAPTLELNTGRYLARGLNQLRSPGGILLDALSPDARRALSEELPPRSPVVLGRTMAPMRSGPKHLVSLPPNTELVDRKWLNLELGGTEREFDVPGFPSWSRYGGGFQERRMSLGKMAPGVYVLQLVQGRIEGQVLLVVSDLAVQAKQTDGEVLVRVAGRDQRAKAGAKVTLYSPAGKGAEGTTDENGEVRLKTTEPKLIVTAAMGKDVAVLDTDFYSTLAISPDVFIYTDRPIYKPGHLIQFKGIVRQPDSFLARLLTPKNREVTVVARGTYGAKTKTTVTVDEYGSFFGTLRAPQMDAGVVTVSARLDKKNHIAEARVKDYVKPTFYLEVSSDQETVRPGETITAKVKARRYSGGPPDEARYEVVLMRTLLDTPAWVDDAGLGASGNAVTYGGESTSEGQLSIPKRLYASAVARGGYFWDENTPMFDENGEATINIPVPELAPEDENLPFTYTLKVEARDEEDSEASSSKRFFYAPTEVLGTLRVNTKVILTGGDAMVAVRATKPSGRPFGKTSGRVEYVLEEADGDSTEVFDTAFETDDDGIWRGDFPPSKAGRLVARVSLDDGQGRTWSGETSILVAGKDGEPVVRVPILSVESLAKTVEPGDQAQLVALFPHSWGPEGRSGGSVWLTLQGTRIFETQRIQVDGTTLVHTFDVEERFGSAVYASLAYPTSSGRWEERVVPFRVVPKERVLHLTIEALAAEAKPLGEQTLDIRVTDHTGRPVKAQLSVGVVDKAIYALQSEFRPSVIDFFYPLVRNNVTSFYSTEFQGYGYGQYLALSRGLIAPYAFSQVKTPTQEEKKDTAYWNPSVVTGRDGSARVTFDLPDSQTLWTVTVVAADTAGRFGERTAEFATRGQINVVASLPRFLRKDDTATGSIRVARGTAGKDPGTLAVSWKTDGAVEAKSGEPTVDFKGQSEHVVPVALTSKGEGTATLAVRIQGGDVRLADDKSFVVAPNTVMESIGQGQLGGGALALNVPEGAEVVSVDLDLMPSTVELALTNLRELLQYPFGCLEQRVATTIPNLAVYQTLTKSEAMGRLDTASQTLLSEARSRAEFGVQQILDLALPDGGFVWFNGYSDPSVPLTLIALDGLAYAREADLVTAKDPKIARSLRWLEGQTDLPTELAATQSYVLSRWQKGKAAPLVRAWLDGIDEANLHAVALAVLSADAAGIMKEDAVATQISTLAQKSYEAMAQVADYRFDQPAYWQYPLRKVGLSAILAHAASFAEVDIEEVRSRLFNVLGDVDTWSTFERSTFLLHSQWLLEHDARRMRTGPKPKIELDRGAEPKLEPLGMGLTATLDPKVRKVNVGSFDGMATLRAQVARPAVTAAAKGEGMTIKRSYYLLRGDERLPIDKDTEVTVGDDVYVELEIDAHTSAELVSLRSAYYVVEDAVPAGFVARQEDKSYRGEPYTLPLDHPALRQRMFGTRSVTLFFEEPAFWSQIPRKIGYVMRAQFAGAFLAPPARVEDMYAAEVFGTSAGRRLTVAPRPKD